MDPASLGELSKFEITGSSRLRRVVCLFEPKNAQVAQARVGRSSLVGRWSLEARERDDNLPSQNGTTPQKRLGMASAFRGATPHAIRVPKGLDPSR